LSEAEDRDKANQDAKTNIMLSLEYITGDEYNSSIEITSTDKKTYKGNRRRSKTYSTKEDNITLKLTVRSNASVVWIHDGVYSNRRK
jgi:hypothetical protein